MSKVEDIYGMARGWMEHPLLKEKQYDKRGAWAWLIENAAWKEHSKSWRRDRPPVELKRGQLIAAVRLMADEWTWSTNRVERFIKILKQHGMIDVKTDTGICVITIMNYNDYQLTPKYNGDTDGDGAGDAGGDADGDNKNKANKVNKDNNNPPSPRKRGKVEPPLLENLPTQFKEPCRFDGEFWPLCPRRENKKKAKEAYDKARLKDSQTNIIAGMRAYRRKYENDDRPAAEKDRFYKWPQGWLNDERWRDFTEGDQDEEDDDEMPKNMTPEEHAKWCARRLGLWRIQ